MGPKPGAYWTAMDSVCAQHELKLYGINGNHENWAESDRLWSAPRWLNHGGVLSPIEVTDYCTPVIAEGPSTQRERQPPGVAGPVARLRRRGLAKMTRAVWA